MKKRLLIILILPLISLSQVTTIPLTPTDSEEITIVFDALGTELEGYTGDVYAFTGVTVNGLTWQNVIGDWGDNDVNPQVTRDAINSNLYTLLITPSIFNYYGISLLDNITELVFVFRSSDAILQTRSDVFTPIIPTNDPPVFDNWGVVGSFNGWGTTSLDSPLSYNETTNNWSAVLTLTDGEIKFRQNNNWSVNYGDDGTDGILDQNGTNIAVVAGDYLVAVNFNTLEYSIKSALVSIPDSNFEQSLIDIGVDTNGPTGDILRSDAEAVSDLQLTNPISDPVFGNPLIQLDPAKNEIIADLTGIDAFVNLKKLGLGHSYITSVDLTFNKELDDLFLNDNQLAEIDISKNTKLTRFGVMRNPNIGAVDVSKNTLLKELFVSNTNINKLDLSKNTVLWRIFAEYTQLYGLDLKSNSSLTDIRVGFNLELAHLNVRNTNNEFVTFFRTASTPKLNCITADDIVSSAMTTYSEDPFSSNCGTVYIPDANFEQALIDQGVDGEIGDPIDGFILQSHAEAATFIDITDRGVSSLIGIESFINLESVQGDRNNIETVDLSDNTKLTQFHLNENNLTSIDFGNNLLLEGVGLNSNDLTEIDLSQQPNLTLVAFGDNENLVNLNLRNGNNGNITEFTQWNLPNLQCITADDLISQLMIESGLSFAADCNNDLFTLAGSWKVSPEPNALVVGPAHDRSRIWWANDAQYVEDWACYFDDEYVFNTNGSFQNILGDATLINYWQGAYGCGTAVSPHDGTVDATYIYNQNTGTITLNGIGAYLVLPKANNQGELPNVPVPSSIIHNVSLTDNNNVMTIELMVGSGTIWTYKLISDKVVYIADQNFENYLETHKADGGEVALGDPNSMGDGILNNLTLINKVDTVTNLNVSNKEISDLTGIEAFINIKELQAGENLLTEIDVSKNINLEKIWVYYNQLTELDLSGNTKMQRISAGGNQISSLNTTGLQDLHTILLWQNQLSSIDMSDNPSLTFVHLHSNNISSVDLTNNQSMINFAIADNPITAFDVSDLDKLESLDVSRTQVSVVDASNNPSLFQLWTYENPNLESLDIRNGNNLNVNLFSLGDTPNLSCINADGTTLSEISQTMINVGDNLGKTFSEDCGDFVYIPDENFEKSLIDLGIDSDGVVNQSILRNDALVVTDLNLNNPAETPDGYGFDNPLITYGNGKITNLEGIEAFVNLTHLQVSFSNLITADVSNNIALQELWISDGILEEIDVIANTNLVRLGVMRNNIGGTIDLSQNLDLEWFLAYDNSITSLDVLNNPNLTNLRVNNNSIPILDVTNNALLERIDAQVNVGLELVTPETGLPNLTSINLSGNDVSSFDASLYPNLQWLLLSNNSLTQLNLKHNTSLANLFIAGNSLLEHLDIRNGNNENVTRFFAADTSLLTCINADSTMSQAMVDAGINFGKTFSEDCGDFIYIPDPNFEQTLIDLDIDSDGVVNQSILRIDSEAQSGILNVSDKNISDLSGIEAFVNLDNLVCSKNLLSHLDVSQNINLTRLNCSDNNLTNLDLSKNIDLTHLICSRNPISNLNLENNTNLIQLAITNLPITEIDLSNNDKLGKFFAIDNQFLSTIDLTHNNNLNQVTITNSIIESLILSNKSKLLFLRLYENPQLAHLDLRNSNNANISRFDIWNTPNLTCINADATLSQSMIDSGKTFNEDCGDFVYIPDANFEQALIDLNIDSDGVVNTSVLREDVTYITTLVINAKNIDNLIGLEAFASLVELQADQNNLLELNVDQNTALQKVWVNANSLTELDFENNIDLVEVRAQKNQINSINVINSPNLESVFLWDNQLETINVLNNPLLKLLFLDENKLIGLDISSNTVLETLIIASNQIKQLDISANKSIKNIYAQNNPNLKLITTAITGSPSLRILNMSNTGLDRFQSKLFIGLERLWLNNNTISSLDVTANSSLNLLEAKSNGLADVDLRNGNNINLTSVNLEGNLLTCVSVDDPDNLSMPYPSWSLDTGVLLSDNCKSEAEIVLIPDPIFEQKLIDEGVDLDGVGLNGSILLSDALATTQLNLYLSSITNMTGIEAFENLESLNASFNNFNEIDLTNCTKLKEVNLSFNNLTSLVLTSGRVLTQLYAGGNDLTSLNLETLTNLINVDLSFNEIESLDASNLDKLRTFDVGNNNLSTLDMRNDNNSVMVDFRAVDNTNLFCIGVDDPSSTSDAIWQKDSQAIFSSNPDCIAPTIIAKDFTVFLDNRGDVTVDAFQFDNGSTDNFTTSGNLVFELNQYDFNCTHLDGPNTIDFFVYDEAGNAASRQVNLYVEDTIPPSLSAKPTLSLDLNGMSMVSIRPTDILKSASDNCDTISYSIDQENFDSPGTYIVTLTATDGSGNSTQDTTEVTIEDSSGSAELKFKQGLTLTVYPVPFNNNALNIVFSKTINLSTVNVVLFTASGSNTGVTFSEVNGTLVSDSVPSQGAAYVLQVTISGQTKTANIVK